MSFTLNDAKEIIAAWDKLPGGRNYSTREVQRWIIEDMAPAINSLRKKVKEHAESQGKSTPKGKKGSS